MRSVGVYEAKNKLSELLDCVEAGEVIALTRHGKQVALITPVNQAQPNARQVVQRLRELRVGMRLGGLSVKSLKNEGRP